mmetsp:Transcript_21841/g.25115  ORF Transcript_21841/g.25115 Transcript_21841/m.25115 type:complete len:132 (-) Transcript_21841:7-402(-)
MVNELVSRKVDLSSVLESVYLLLLLKLDEEQTSKKYTDYLIVKNDNLLVWSEVLMEASLMNSLITPESTNLNSELITKIAEVVDKLTEQNDLLLHAQFMLHNLMINEGIVLPQTDDPSKELLADDSVIIEK